MADPAWSPGRSKAKWEKVTSAGLGKPEPLSARGIPAGNVAAINDAPTSDNVGVTAIEDTSLDIVIDATDVDTQRLDFVLQQVVQQGQTATSSQNNGNNTTTEQRQDPSVRTQAPDSSMNSDSTSRNNSANSGSDSTLPARADRN